MGSKQRLFCKYIVDGTYFDEVWHPVEEGISLLHFIELLGLEVDDAYTHHYVIVDERKWVFTKLKYGI